MRPSAVEELRLEARDLLGSLEATPLSSPLRAIAERLISFLGGILCAIDYGQAPISLRQAIATARGIMSLVPGTFGRRFDFDAMVIASVLDEWARAGARVSPFTIPRYSPAWGYYRVIMPSEDVNHAHVVRVVTFPGADRVSDIDLSDYPWLIHELAHDAFYRSEHRFRAVFGAQLEARLNQLRLRAGADTGSAARRATQNLETLARYWTPRADQHDWAHEIATDITALWALGPGFLMRFTRLVADDPHRSCQAADQHPPYVTRAEALALGAERLQWADEAWELREELRTLRERVEGDATALVYADPELILAAVEAAFESCRALSIPRMTAARFARLRRACESEAALFTGIDLIAAAAIARVHFNAADYATWHDELVEHVA